MANSLHAHSTTWRCLAKSRNRAAIEILTAGLKELEGEDRLQCAAALMERPEPEAQEAIIRSWAGINGSVSRLRRSSTVRLSKTAERILVDGDASEQQLALRVIADLGLPETMNTIVQIVICRNHPSRADAVNCMMKLCKQWGSQARASKDASRVRTHMLEAIVYQIDLFHENRCGDLIDAWLTLAHWDDSAHRRLIANPTHSAYRQVIMRLKGSKAAEVLQLLAGYLMRCRTAPNTIIETLVARPDPKLAIEIARLIDDNSMVTALNSLRRLKPLACLEKIEPELPTLEASLQRKVWLMISASSDDINLVLHGALKLSESEDEDAAAIAAAMIRGCRRPDSESIVSDIQVALAAPHDENAVGRKLLMLTTWLDSETPLLKDAAAQFFKDFTIDGLVDAVRMWPSQMCRAMAKIVLKLESEYASILTRQLQSPAPRRRLAALEVVHLMGVAGELSDVLVQLLEDPKVEVRVQCIDLLSGIGHKAIIGQLPGLLSDASSDVQEAAERADRKFQRQRAVLAAGADHPGI